MTATYKAIEVSAPGDLRVVDRQIVEPGPSQVRIRVEACGICHTDAYTVTGTYPGLNLPRVPGHEVIGRIDALGQSVSRWKIGQRVGVGLIAGEDGICEPCRRGDAVNCLNPADRKYSKHTEFVQDERISVERHSPPGHGPHHGREANPMENEGKEGRTPMDARKRSSTACHFEEALREKVVGQEEAVQAIVDLYQVFCAGLHCPGRPVGNLLFLGPTGSGKTRTVEAAAEILFGDSRAVIKVDCAEFQHSHEIAKLIGSPPGYLGHRETHPLITQEALAASHREGLKLSFLLFDEIEKASDALWQLLLGMLDKATLTLGDNRRVDLSQTVIFLTSNLGGSQIADLMQGGMGFIQPNDKPRAGLQKKVERAAVEAARRRFSPEFMNRLDKLVVFHPLKREELDEVLEIELRNFQKRILDSTTRPFLFRVTEEGREFLMQEGTDQRYGARHLKRAIERYVVCPIARLLATAQVHQGDMLLIDRHPGDKGLAFSRDTERRFSDPKVALAARNSGQLTTAEVHA